MNDVVTAAVGVFGCVSLLWMVSVLAKDASIVDIFWGLGFVVIAWVCDVRGVGDDDRRRLVAMLVTVWGVRLALHLARRNLGKGEDHRYVAMRQQHGARFFWVSLFTVFWLQGGLMLLVALPLFASSRATAPLWGLDAVGTLAVIAGVLFESIGDWQLARFKSDPAHAGQVMDRGLWRLTRHPNYFGDACVWWGLGLIGASSGAVWCLLGPLVMTGLLLKVSGVTLLERTIVERRPAYRAYIERTSAFIPWPPRLPR